MQKFNALNSSHSQITKEIHFKKSLDSLDNKHMHHVLTFVCKIKVGLNNNVKCHYNQEWHPRKREQNDKVELRKCDSFIDYMYSDDMIATPHYT